MITLSKWKCIVLVASIVLILSAFQQGNFPPPVQLASQFCGTTSACSATAQASTKAVYGSAALVSGTPSTVTITGISPAFTSNSSYKCIAQDQTTVTNVVGVSSYVSGASFTITGPATNTDTVAYFCFGA